MYPYRIECEYTTLSQITYYWFDISDIKNLFTVFVCF